MVWLSVRIVVWAKVLKRDSTNTKEDGWMNCRMSCGRTTQQSKLALETPPFSLVYGTEAVIPAEIGMPTIRMAEVNVTTNDDE